MTGVMNVNGAFHPANVGFLGTTSIVFPTDGLTNQVEQAGLGGLHAAALLVGLSFIHQCAILHIPSD